MKIETYEKEIKVTDYIEGYVCVEEFLETFEQLLISKEYTEEFGAKVYKIYRFTKFLHLLYLKNR